MNTLQKEFSRLELGEPAHFRGLTLLPLLREEPSAPEPDYLLLEEAIGLGVARVTELNGGTVPELRFENMADRPVLLLDGEELIGAKQNRVLNLTILAPARQSIVIPVSCVEAGRWNMTSPDFQPAEHLMYSRARAARSEQVTESMRTTGTRRSDQSAVWEEIAAKACRMEAASPTQAMSALFERHAISVEEFVRAFTWRERQAGVAFAVNGQPSGLDLFDHPSTMRCLFPKLVRSYALDALDASGARNEPAGRAVFSELLARASTATTFAQPAVGLGKDVRLSGASLSGAALWAENRYIHVCAFNADGDRSAGASLRTRMTRPSHRRSF
jgi:hypothetical protein